jgi:hypothetical protein
MHTKNLLAGLACLALVAGQSHAQERWAAVDANSEGSAPVVWDTTKESAEQKAVAACKRISRTCSGEALTTSDMSHTIAFMCCTVPRLGCAMGGGATREEAAAVVRKVFVEASFSECTVRHYISAATGRRSN